MTKTENRPRDRVSSPPPRASGEETAPWRRHSAGRVRPGSLRHLRRGRCRRGPWFRPRSGRPGGGTLPATGQIRRRGLGGAERPPWERGTGPAPRHPARSRERTAGQRPHGPRGLPFRRDTDPGDRARKATAGRVKAIATETATMTDSWHKMELTAEAQASSPRRG